jgi:CDP-paratose 2-epimerase
MEILITGGAGFVGANLAIKLKDSNSHYSITCLDNFKRRGSELNLPRLKAAGIDFVHGDIRNKDDLKSLKNTDLIVECSAEPSVLAGLDGSPDYLVQTNLVGTYNCLEYARAQQCGFIFLSTSRVYPIKTINSLNYRESKTRFDLEEEQDVLGASRKGFSEDFPLKGARSLYGTTKLASELLIDEYRDFYDLKAIVNRCGVISGPWQMGKVDQGVLVYWIAAHLLSKPLTYFGYSGSGKQVRDVIHIEDLFQLIDFQINNLNDFNGKTYNVGGGLEHSFSLLELTELARELTGVTMDVKADPSERVADLKLYLTDNTLVEKETGWSPSISVRDTVQDVITWMKPRLEELRSILF